MHARSTQCWSIDPKAEGIRIEISSDRRVLFSFNRFIYSELTTEDDEQSLRLVFVTHEVLVGGTCLKRIELAMQHQHLAWLARLPDDRRALIPDGHPVVLEILVNEVAPDS